MNGSKRKCDGYMGREKVMYSQGRWGIPSDNSDRIYVITWSEAFGMWVCECPDFVYRRAQRRDACKHIQKLRDFLDHASYEQFNRLINENEIEWDGMKEK